MLKLLEGETLIARTKGLLINSDANGFDVLSYMKKLDILQLESYYYIHTPTTFNAHFVVKISFFLALVFNLGITKMLSCGG